jgi:predicted aconitase with swiveling domain
VASAAQTGAVGAGGPPTTYQGTATSTVIAPPSIISFTTGTDPTSGKTVLIPTFTSDSNAFATAFINPGNLGATSGQETPIVQSGDTAYTLTVINSAGSLVTSQPLTVKGTVTPNTGGSGVHRKLKGGKEQKTAPPLPF